MTDQLFEIAQLYPDMSFVDYCDIKALNASSLMGIGGISPRHLRAVLAGEIERDDSPDMRLGRAIHCWILEPERFAESFPVADPCNGIIASGANKGNVCGNQSRFLVDGQWRCGTHAPKGTPEVADLVTPRQRADMDLLSKSLHECPANEFLAAPGYHEAVVVWSQLGFDMKTRLDKLSVTNDRIVVIDFKKMQVGDGDFEDRQRACLNRKYHIQAWFHFSAIQAKFGTHRPIDQYFLFVEDGPPFGTHLLKVSEDDLRIADRQICSLLQSYRRCEQSGKWFDYQMVINPDKAGILPARYVHSVLHAGE